MNLDQPSAPGTGGWIRESVRGDSAFNEASLFTVTATTAAGAGAGRNRHACRHGDSGERTKSHTLGRRALCGSFLLHMSPHFESDSMDAYGTTITSYWLPGDEQAGQAALAHAVSALRFYSDHFGDYPFLRHADCAGALVVSRHGVSSGQSAWALSFTRQYREDLETLAVHEIAHQWWYQIVHNDPVRMPWLDEALAEFSMGMYYEALHGRKDADLLEYQRWEIPLDLLEEREGDSNLARHRRRISRTVRSTRRLSTQRARCSIERLRQHLGRSRVP